ncbi:hypothetical protein QJS04_geneDACA024622 [Acorus gramineus]|uniref:Reverse transcriptase n=1 Tax=Acorus gramineus TaxID=55184 RepID=A0AAV8ZZM0_ACOGR|nr:hypothetical protein QJS04_geneDACA024622 [Acorus gramineus]
MELIAFLGYVISSEGISVDPGKTLVASNWRRPSNPARIRSFPSLASYCRKLDEGLSKIAVPLNRLTWKDVRFEWSPSCEESFLEFYRRLTSAPILTSPSWSGGFAVG